MFALSFPMSCICSCLLLFSFSGKSFVLFTTSYWVLDNRDQFAVSFPIFLYAFICFKMLFPCLFRTVYRHAVRYLLQSCLSMYNHLDLNFLTIICPNSSRLIIRPASCRHDFFSLHISLCLTLVCALRWSIIRNWTFV